MKEKLITGLLCLLFVGCSNPDPLPAGIVTKVHGKILEDIGNEPVARVKVQIAEYRYRSNLSTGSYDEFQAYVKSTYTDANGNYELSFTTTGNGTSYKVRIDDPLYDEQQLFTNFDFDEKLVEPLGKDFLLNPKGIYNLYPCNIKMDLKAVTQFPIYMRHATTPSDNIKIEDVDQYTLRLNITKHFSQSLVLTNSKGTYVYNFLPSGTNELTEHSLVLSDADFVK